MIRLHINNVTDSEVINQAQRLMADPFMCADVSMSKRGSGSWNISIKVNLDDDSYRYQSLMQFPELVLKFSLPAWVDFPIGTFCTYQSQLFYLFSPQDIKKQGTRNISYTLTMHDITCANMNDCKLRNSVDMRLKFTMTGKPLDFLNEIAANLQRMGKTLRVESNINDTPEKTITFNHVSLLEALNMVASAFETEWEIRRGSLIYLGKVEYNKTTPLELSYGRGNGFVPGVGRTTLTDQTPVKTLFVQGGERNIDPSKYFQTLSPALSSDEPKPKELLLPRAQKLSYDGEQFFYGDAMQSTDTEHIYLSSPDGRSISRTNPVNDKATREESKDCSDIYPSRESTPNNITYVTNPLSGAKEAIIAVDPEHNLYDFIDDTIPEDLNYRNLLIAGAGKLTVVFQTGMLAGKEFEADYDHSQRRFKLVPQEIDGQTMPNATYLPTATDKYKVFNISLPAQYICDNVNHEGASWDMFRQAAKYLYDNEEQKFTFTGEVQGLWARQHWSEIGGKFVVGGYVRFTDPQFCPNGALIRITGIKDYLNTPYAPVIEISNSAKSSSSVSSQLAKIDNAEIIVADSERRMQQFTQRRFSDAKQTAQMLQQTFIDNYTSGITPVTVQTMSTIIGDESLQFRFLACLHGIRSDTALINPDYEARDLYPNPVTYDEATSTLTCARPDGSPQVPMYLQHLTLGINSITPQKDYDSCLKWQMQDFSLVVSGELYDNKGLWLYARCSVNDQTEQGTFLVSDHSIPLMAESGYYHFLVGILTSGQGAPRSFASLFGFTEILPGRITTDKIISTDGKTYFDLANSEIGGNIRFLADSDNYLTLIEGGKIVTNLINTNELITRKLQAAAATGEEIIIDPAKGKGMTVKDAQGNIVAIFSGETFDGVEDIFDNSSGRFRPYNTTFNQDYGIRRDTAGVTGYSTDFISQLVQTRAPAQVIISALSVEAFATSSSSLADSGFAAIAVKIFTYQNADCSDTPIETEICSYRAHATKDYRAVTDRVVDLSTSVYIPKGYHKIGVSYILEVTGSATASVSYNLRTPFIYNCQNYIARYFANGLCLGSSALNYVTAYRDTDDVMRFKVMNQGKYMEFSPAGFRVEIGNMIFKINDTQIAYSLNGGTTFTSLT